MTETYRINCPKCGAHVISQPFTVAGFYDPRFKCKKCDIKTPLIAKRPSK